MRNGLLRAALSGSAGDIVSQEELEKLSATLDQYAATSSKTNVEVTLYDFRQAYRLSAAQVQIVVRDCERVAAALDRTLKVYLNGEVGLKLLSVDRMKSHQYLQMVPHDAALASFGQVAHLPKALVHIDRAAGYAVIDMMLGGRGTPDSTVRDDLTPLEVRLLRLFFKEFLATAQVAARSLSIAREPQEIYLSPTAVDCLEEDVWVLCASYRIEVGACRGNVSMVFPSSTIQRCLADEDHVASEGAEVSLSQVAGAPVSVRAVLSHAALPMGVVAKLKVGDTLKLQSFARNARKAEIEVAGLVKFLGLPGTSDGQMAVQLTDIIRKHAV